MSKIDEIDCELPRPLRMGLLASPGELAPRSLPRKGLRGVEVLSPRTFGTVPVPHPNNLSFRIRSTT